MAGPLVLVVEDRQFLADLLCRVLGEAGYETLAVPHRGALAAARNALPRLILVNRSERRVLALKVAGQLHDDPETRSIPVVAMPPKLGRLLELDPGDEQAARLAVALAALVASVRRRLGPA